MRDVDRDVYIIDIRKAVVRFAKRLLLIATLLYFIIAAYGKLMVSP